MPTVFIGLIVIFGAASYVILGEFKDIETRQEQADVGGALEALDARRDELDRTTRDWAHWDDTYNFVKGQFPQYVDVDLAPKSFAAYGLSFMLFLNGTAAQESIVYGSGFDPATESFQPLPSQLADAAQRHALGLTPLDTEEGHITGIIRVGDDLHFVSSWAILDSQEAGPAVGTLTWGRQIDEDLVEQLSNQVHRRLTVEPWGGPLTEAVGGAATLDEDGAWHLTRPNDERMWFSIRLDDLHGEPVALVYSSAARELYQGGLKAMTATFVASLVIATIFLIVGSGLMHRLVTGRVQRLGRHMKDLRSGTAGPGAPLTGKDEVADMAREFDNLMVALENRTRALERSNADLKGFASVVSHDLQSPLSTLRLNVALLRPGAEARGDAKAVEQLERIERTGLRMSERIQSLLEYSRASQVELKMDRVALRKVVDDVRRDMDAEFARSMASLKVGDLPDVNGDEGQITRVFQNLFSNAIKYRRAGVAPVLRVNASDRGTSWAIAVEDEGMGFTAQEASELLRPFKRLANSQGIAGHGVGLAACANILQRHGGKLEVEGRPGKGATFTLVLPKAQATEMPTQTPMP